MKRSLGKFSKRTRCLRRRVGEKLTTRAVLRSFSVGDRVCINPAPSQEGLPHPRYRGRHGIVVGKRGNSYVVEVKIGNSTKKLIVSGMHLRK
ncbi:MAG: 50S ribosomal protein L21e [Candidatus Micrarchaeia archaeon]